MISVSAPLPVSLKSDNENPSAAVHWGPHYEFSKAVSTQGGAFCSRRREAAGEPWAPPVCERDSMLPARHRMSEAPSYLSVTITKEQRNLVPLSGAARTRAV